MINSLTGRVNALWPEWDRAVTTVEALPPNSERAIFYRERKSHVGISAFSKLKALKALQVNQGFLEEIGELKSLEYLELHMVTAEDLSPIAQLNNLRTIKASGLRKAKRFEPLLSSPLLRRLFIEDIKHLSSLEFLATAEDLVAIGIEGSLWKTQRLQSLKPLAALPNLECLFLTSTALEDKDLSYLSRCPKLRILECSRFASRSEFMRLRRLMPNLQCTWCDRYEV